MAFDTKHYNVNIKLEESLKLRPPLHSSGCELWLAMKNVWETK